MSYNTLCQVTSRAAICAVLFDARVLLLALVDDPIPVYEASLEASKVAWTQNYPRSQDLLGTERGQLQRMKLQIKVR